MDTKATDIDQERFYLAKRNPAVISKEKDHCIAPYSSALPRILKATT